MPPAKISAQFGQHTRMKDIALFSLLMIAVAGQKEYSCVHNGIPAIAITARESTHSPAREFFLPLFANCSDAELRRPLQYMPGKSVVGLTYYNTDR